MHYDSDVALIGTGAAALVAANTLLHQGKSVLILNPDLDFFLEDSELPLDPLLHGKISPLRLFNNTIEQALEVIRPVYPGSIEVWPHLSEKSGYHDPSAPHLRQRGRLWISSFNQDRHWEKLEDLYVEASDAGLNPQILEGLPAIRRFPGVSSNTDNFKGLFIPKLCDIDVSRYRNGLLEYIRERLAPEKMACAVTQLEPIAGGLRFHARGTLNTAKIKEAVLVFWTPRLSQWVLNQAKRTEVTPYLPKGVRIWEQWSINSRESPTPNTVGMLEDMAVWADFEGVPTLSHSSQSLKDHPTSPRLAVLRSGPLISLNEMESPLAGNSWVSGNSFGGLSYLCHDFLKWDRFSIRSLRARAVFEWADDALRENLGKGHWFLSKEKPGIHVISGCDGPLIQIIRTVRSACEDLNRGNL